MEQRDYIKRQIEQIGIVLGGLFNRLLGRTLEIGGSTIPAEGTRKQDIHTMAAELAAKVQETYGTIDITLL